ncbi:hypothetical+protein [Methylocapsa aurea]|uniref:phage tail length tape measure family protein n=1 Tax=Methylocapsa aurea TaxID=663610 RepID=UPI003D18B02A
MAVSLDVIRTLTTKARTEGVDAARRDLEAYAASQQKVASTGDGMRTSNDNATKSILRANDAFAKLERSIDPVARANAQLAAAQVKVQRAINDGSVEAGRAASVLALLASRHADTVAAAQKGKEALDAHTEAAGLNRMQVMESIHVLKAFGDEVVAGQNPLRALAMEGGRIGQIFASGDGGAGGTLRAFGGILTGVVLNPLTLTVAALGTAGVATLAFVRQQEELERALNGVGRAAGVSADGLREAGVAGAAKGGITSGQGIELAGQLAGTGRIGADLMPGIIGSTQRYARAFGLDLGDAGKELASAFADPTKGAEELDKRLGFLDDRTKTLIRDFQEQGNVVGAQKALFDAYKQAIDKTTDTTWGLSKAWEAVKGVVADVSQGIGRALDPSTEQKLDRLIKLRDSLDTAPKLGIAGLLGMPAQGHSPYLDQQIADLQKQLAAEKDKAARAAADLETTRRSGEASDIVRGVLPEIGQRQSLVNRRNNLSGALADPETLHKMGVSADEANHALTNLTYQVDHWTSSVDRAREDSALASRQTDAWTFAERAAVASDRARLEVLRQSGDAALAAAEAEKARNALIAEGNRKADDMAKAAKDQVELLGLSPYEAAKKRVDQKYRDFDEQHVPEKSDLAPYIAPLRSGFDAAGNAARSLADALNGAAGKIGRLVPLSEWQGGQTSAADPRGLTPYIRDRAAAYGIDPDVATRVARSEGLRDFTGDNGTSFGAFQLHTGGGVGDEFRKSTGLDPSDPANERATIDYALKIAAQRGWSPWHGAAKVGIGEFEGIGGAGGVPVLKSTAGPTAAGAKADELKAVNYEYIDAKIKAVNLGLDDQNRLLEAQKGALGADNATLQGVIEAQKLANQYIDAGVPLTGELSAKIAAYGQAVAESAKKSEEATRLQKQATASLDFVRSSFDNVLSGVGTAAAHGQSIGKSLESSFQGIEDNLIKSASSMVTDGLLGGKGQAGGGLLGGALGQLFGISSQSTGTMTVNAGVVTVNGGIGGVGGAGGGGGILGWIGSLFGGGSDVGHNAAGTSYWPGGATWVGENGPELLNAPRGSSIMPSPQSLAYARSIANAGNDNARGSNGGAPAGKSEVYFHGAPEGTQMKETFDGNGNRRADITFKEMVAGAIKSPTGVSAMRNAGRMTKY